MRRIGIMAAASALFGAGAASAADIYTGGPGGGFKDEPVYAVNSWSGFYFGTNGGGAWTSNNGTLDLTATTITNSPLRTPAIASASAKVSPSGAFGGGQIGYNWQRDGLMLGIEADFDFSSVYDKPSAGATAVPTMGSGRFPATANLAAKSELEDFGTVRGRGGWSFGSLLVYGTGGFAYGSVRDRLSVSDSNFGLTASGSVSSDRTATGWAAGGGFQYAFTPAVSWKAEYLHLDLGSTALSQTAAIPALGTSAAASLTVHHDYDIVRTGLNYRLGSNEPLAIADALSGWFEGGGGLKDASVYPVSWAGFYGGINSGAAWSEHEGTLTASANAVGTIVTSSAKESPSGPLGGAQIGYNWQFGRFLLGVEADVDAAAVQDKAFVTSLAVAATAATSQAAAKSDLDYFGTLRARAGYSFDRFLVYGTGGFAFGGVRDRLSLTNVDGAFGFTATTSGNSSETATGWAAGAGLEVALTPQWSLKTEYLHLDLGSTTLTEAAISNPGTSGSASLTVHHEYDIVRSGVNYRFGSYEPLK
jgi:outer membrane immunogenic protein